MEMLAVGSATRVRMEYPLQKAKARGRPVTPEEKEADKNESVESDPTDEH
jgi:hypothetical protein